MRRDLSIRRRRIGYALRFYPPGPDLSMPFVVLKLLIDQHSRRNRGGRVAGLFENRTGAIEEKWEAFEAAYLQHASNIV